MILRNEWKYRIKNSARYNLEFKLDKVLHFDEHADKDGKYVIRSLYFDDYYLSSFFDNNIGNIERKKWRIRYYGDDISSLRLEKKVKKNDKGFKLQCKLSEEDFYSIINNDYEYEFKKIYDKSTHKVLKEFLIEKNRKKLRPTTIIEYVRKAYYDKYSDIRITFDDNLFASKDFKHFLDRTYSKKRILPANENILEVKSNSFLPDYISDLFNKRVLTRNSYSKYYNGIIANRIM